MSARAQNAILCLVSYVIASGFIAMTTDISYPSNVFPYIVSISILIFTTIVFFTQVIREVREDTKGSNTTESPKGALLKTLFIASISIIYAICIPYGGFYFTSTIFLIIIFIIAHPKRLSLHLMIKATSVTILVLLIVFFVFNYFLNVPTPKGLLI
jgi:hypothetical protein